MQAPQTIQVLVRARPYSEVDGVADSETSGVKIDATNSLVSFTRDKKGQSDFQFTKVFDHNGSQNDIYGVCNVVQDVAGGINCCIMAYGQTGSGKTYTMYGSGWEDLNTTDTNKQSINRQSTNGNGIDLNKSTSSLNMNQENDMDSDMDSIVPDYMEDDERLGIIPRAVSDLFRLLEIKSNENPKFDYSVSCQIMQIYNEKIFDLMQDKRRENPLHLRDTHGDKGEESAAGLSGTVHVRGMSVYRVYSKQEALQLLKQGMRNRAIRATEFNNESSRSHTILQLFVTVEEADEQGLMVLKRSTFSLVDLAGSEKWRSSLSTSTSSLQAEALVQAQMKEMTHINTSLHVLGNCVSALIEPNRKHIPFRDSVLTRLLQDPLGGNGRTILIATIHADAGHREETYSTLQFASRASHIKVALNVNVGINERANLAEAQHQIKMLRAKLLELQLQGVGVGRSREGSVPPSPRLSVEDAQQKQLNSSSSGGGSAQEPVGRCTQCMLNDKLIAALRLKVIELHKENQALRGHAAFEGSQFRTPRKPLPLGSSLTKLSAHPHPHHHPNIAGEGTPSSGSVDRLNSSMSSVDSHISPTTTIVRKKKKNSSISGSGSSSSKASAAGDSKGSKKAKSGSSSRPTTADAQTHEQEQEEEQGQEHLGAPRFQAPLPFPPGISSSSFGGDTDAVDSAHLEAEMMTKNELLTVPAASSSVSDRLQIEPPALTGSPKSLPQSTSKAAGKRAKAEDDVRNREYAPAADKDNNLHFSDSSIEKALKAANMILGSPPSGSLSLLNLLSTADGDISSCQFAAAEAVKSPPKKKKVAKAKHQAKSDNSAAANNPFELEESADPSSSSPSPPRQPAGTGAAAREVQPVVYQQSGSAPATSSSYAPQEGQLNMRAGAADFLAHIESDGMKSPPMLRRTAQKESTSAAAAAAGGGNHNSLNGAGVGYAGTQASSSSGASSAVRTQPPTPIASIQGAPTRTTSSSPAPAAPAPTPQPQPLPMLTPARKLIQNSNPDACQKHGLEQCVLCQIFGGGGGGGNSYNDNAVSVPSFAVPSISYSAYNDNQAAPLDYQAANVGAFPHQQQQTHAHSPYNGQVLNPINSSFSSGAAGAGTGASAEGERRKSKSKSKNSSINQLQPQYDDQLSYASQGESFSSDGGGDYLGGASSYQQPAPIQIPPPQMQQQQQQQSWMNRSNDFSPSGIYGSTMDLIGNKQQKLQMSMPISMQYSDPAMGFADQQEQQQQQGPVTCKIHGVTECLLCTIRGAHLRKPNSKSSDPQGYHSNAASDSYQHQPQLHIETQNAYGAPSSGAFASIGSPAPFRMQQQQDFVSTVDSSDAMMGYGFQNTPSDRSCAQAQQQQQQQQGGIPFVPGLVVQKGGARHQQSEGVSYHTAGGGGPQQQQLYGAQVRNVKSIPLQRQHYAQPDYDSGQEDVSIQSGFTRQQRAQQPQKNYLEAPASVPKQRSQYGNSVQTVQALRQQGGPSHPQQDQQYQQQQMMYPRSSSSPLPQVQQSILPSIMSENTYAFHPQVSAQAADRQYSHGSGGYHQQYQYQFQQHQQAGSKITYVDDNDQEGEEEGDGDGDEGAFDDTEDERGVGTGAGGAGKGGAQAGAAGAVGRTVIKKKKKLKKKSTRKVTSTITGNAVAIGAPYGAVPKRKL